MYGWGGQGLPLMNLTAQDKHEITAELAKHGCYPVYLTKSQVELYYEGYSNDTLWPLFHYFQSLTRQKEEYWQAYVEVNKLFEAAVKRVASSASSIWIHDYQLMVLPKLLQKTFPPHRLVFSFIFHSVIRDLPTITTAQKSF